MIKAMAKQWASYAARISGGDDKCVILRSLMCLCNLMERYNLGYPGVKDRTMLNTVYKEVDRIQVAQSKAFCKHSNEPSGSIKVGQVSSAGRQGPLETQKGLLSN